MYKMLISMVDLPTMLWIIKPTSLTNHLTKYYFLLSNQDISSVTHHSGLADSLDGNLRGYGRNIDCYVKRFAITKSERINLKWPDFLKGRVVYPLRKW